MVVLHVRRWVIWWFCLGVICGVTAIVNIFFRELTRAQDRVILFIGVIFWLLGGLVCWAWEGVKLNKLPTSAAGNMEPDVIDEPRREIKSELVAYQIRQALSRRFCARPEPLGSYIRRHWEQEQKHHS